MVGLDGDVSAPLDIPASGKLCEHGCTVADYGSCVFGCPRPGCREYPSPVTPGYLAGWSGRFLCWSCGKWLFGLLGQPSIDRPLGSA